MKKVADCRSMFDLIISTFYISTAVTRFSCPTFSKLYLNPLHYIEDKLYLAQFLGSELNSVGLIITLIFSNSPSGVAISQASQSK